MTEFLHSILTFPALPLTVAMGVVLLYWLFVIIGAVGLDALDGGAESVAGGAKAAGEALAGGAKAAGEALTGAAKAAGEVLGGGGHDAIGGDVGGHDVGGHDAGGHDASDGGGLMAVLGLGKVPITITFSAVTFFAWAATVLASRPLEGFGLLPRLGVLLGALVASLFVSSVALRPMGKLFQAATPASRHDVIGQLCTISSGKVEANFGTATVDDGAAGLNVHVVCSKQNTLKKGDRALLSSFDAEREVYEVEPLDWLEPAEQEALKDPARAQSVIANKIRLR
jgi:hypothetical protein